MNKPQYIIIHHSASPRDKTTIEQINAWHKARGFPISSLGLYVGYHYVIFPDGSVKQTRANTDTGAHAKTNDGMNFKSIGICLTGNFEVEQLTIGAMDALEKLVLKLRAEYCIKADHVLGHRDVSATACPGKNLYQFIHQLKQN